MHNTTLPAGTRVRYREDDRTISETTTRSAPWQLGDGTWVVKLDGNRPDGRPRVGGYLLDRVTPI